MNHNESNSCSFSQNVHWCPEREKLLLAHTASTCSTMHFVCLGVPSEKRCKAHRAWYKPPLRNASKVQSLRKNTTWIYLEWEVCYSDYSMLFLHSHHGPWYLTLTPCVLHINGNHMASSVDFRKHVCASASACAYACSAVCAVMWCDVMQPKNTTSCDAYYIII